MTIDGVTRREFVLTGIAAVGSLVVPREVFGENKEKISDITTVVDDSNYAKEVYEHKGKAIVLFYANWGEKSAKIFPLFRELVEEYSNQVKFCSYELDESYKNWKTDSKVMEKWEKLKKKYGIDTIPRIHMYVYGKLDDYVRGAPSKKVPEKVIKEFVVKWIKTH